MLSLLPLKLSIWSHLGITSASSSSFTQSQGLHLPSHNPKKLFVQKHFRSTFPKVKPITIKSFHKSLRFYYNKHCHVIAFQALRRMFVVILLVTLLNKTLALMNIFNLLYFTLLCFRKKTYSIYQPTICISENISK